MSDSSTMKSDYDHLVFETNQRKLSPAELVPYMGKHIAWSLDGTRILASGGSMEEVCRALESMGLDPLRAVHGYIPTDNEVRL